MKSNIVTEQLEEWMQSGVPMEQLDEDMNKDQNSFCSTVKEEADEKN